MPVTHKTHRGFTLNELIIVVAIFVLMSALSLPYLGDFYRNENIGAHCKNLRQTMYRASYRAIAGERYQKWGVKINSDSYVLFAGPDYASRLTQFDETHDIPNTMTLTGISEVQFTKFNGEPNVTGTISIIYNGNTNVCATLVETGLVE